MQRLGQVPLGGTAVGTGMNTHPEFAERVRARLAADTGLRISPPADPFESQAARDGLVEASGALKTLAVSLTKIANDLRFMGSGPRAGLAEIFLPELQKGSSIMPGKVNPVIPEVVTQVAAQVIGNDAAIVVGGMQGHFELNVFVPLMARNLLQSIKLLASAARLLDREVRRGDRGEPRAVRALRRADPVGGDRPEPVYRLRQGDRDRQEGGGVGPVAARGRPGGGRLGRGARRGARLPQDGQSARLISRLSGYCGFDISHLRCARLVRGEVYRFLLRMPEELRQHLADAARTSERSLNREIVARLEASFEATQSVNRVRGERSMGIFKGRRALVVLAVVAVAIAALTAVLATGGSHEASLQQRVALKQMQQESQGIENGGAGGEANDYATASAQFAQARTAPSGIVAPGAYSAAFTQLHGTRCDRRRVD